MEDDEGREMEAQEEKERGVEQRWELPKHEELCHEYSHELLPQK